MRLHYASNIIQSFLVISFSLLCATLILSSSSIPVKLSREKYFKHTITYNLLWGYVTSRWQKCFSIQYHKMANWAMLEEQVATIISKKFFWSRKEFYIWSKLTDRPFYYSLVFYSPMSCISNKGNCSLNHFNIIWSNAVETKKSSHFDSLNIIHLCLIIFTCYCTVLLLWYDILFWFFYFSIFLVEYPILDEKN